MGNTFQIEEQEEYEYPDFNFGSRKRRKSRKKRTSRKSRKSRRRYSVKTKRKSRKSSRKSRKSTSKKKLGKLYKGYAFVSIKKSRHPKYKMQAVFLNTKTGKNKTVKFGAKGYSDYTIHKDDERKRRYMRRHRKREKWSDPMTAGSLSRYILWNKKTLKASIDDYKKRFFKL